MLNNELIHFLRRLGLGKEEGEIFLLLSERGPLTPLEISRISGINRTKVYRTLEDMCERQLATEEVQENSKKYISAGEDKLHKLLKERQTRIAELSEKFPIVSAALSQLKKKDQQDTKVLYYRGAKGVSQMIWNELRAKKEIVGYSYRAIETVAGAKFANDFYQEFVRRNLTIRDLYGEEYQRSLKNIKRAATHDNPERINNIKSRFISEKVLEIPLQMDIYNEVVAMYSWQNQEVFGVEIYNGKVAKLQRQLFELAWKYAK